MQARELATLTGASLLLVVVSEGGTVFSFASDKRKSLTDIATIVLHLTWMIQSNRSSHKLQV